MDGKRPLTRAEAITALCKARDDINAAIFALRTGRTGPLPWDIYCMWVEDAGNAAEKLRERTRGGGRR